MSVNLVGKRPSIFFIRLQKISCTKGLAGRGAADSASDGLSGDILRGLGCARATEYDGYLRRGGIQEGPRILPRHGAPETDQLRPAT